MSYCNKESVFAIIGQISNEDLEQIIAQANQKAEGKEHDQKNQARTTTNPWYDQERIPESNHPAIIYPA